MMPAPAWADGIELKALDVTPTDDGLMLSYTARVDLPKAVEDALQKGVPLYFVAQAELFRSRWYWRDKLLVRSLRNWRLTWQPLTRRYRLNFGSLSQSYETLGEALAAIDRAARWKLLDAGGLDADTDHYLEFSFKLDTSQLPRPLEISFGERAEWQLAVERSLRVPASGATPAAVPSAPTGPTAPPSSTP